MHSSYFQVQLSDWLYERHFTAFFVCSFTVVHHISCFLLILPTFYFLIIIMRSFVFFFLVYLQYDDVCLLLYHFALKQLKNMAHLSFLSFFFLKNLSSEILCHIFISFFTRRKLHFYEKILLLFACLCKKNSLEK